MHEIQSDSSGHRGGVTSTRGVHVTSLVQMLLRALASTWGTGVSTSVAADASCRPYTTITPAVVMPVGQAVIGAGAPALDAAVVARSPVLMDLVNLSGACHLPFPTADLNMWVTFPSKRNKLKGQQAVQLWEVCTCAAWTRLLKQGSVTSEAWRWRCGRCG
jgi:hypothetical protein